MTRRFFPAAALAAAALLILLSGCGGAAGAPVQEAPSTPAITAPLPTPPEKAESTFTASIRAAMISCSGEGALTGSEAMVYNACVSFSPDSFRLIGPVEPEELEEAVLFACEEEFDAVILVDPVYYSLVPSLAEKHASLAFILPFCGEADLNAHLAGGDTPLPYTADNVCCIAYREEICGYLAGYAAVRSGSTGPAVIYDSSDTPQLLYALGFIQGADAAAAEKPGRKVSIHYADAPEASADELVSLAAEKLCDTVFLCSREDVSAFLPAAAEAGIPLITADPAGAEESTARGISFYVDRGCSASIKGVAYAMAKGSFTGGYYDYFSGGAELFASSYSPLCASAGFSPGFTFADYVQIRNALAGGRVLVSRDTGRTPESLATVTSVSALSVEDAPEQQ